MRSVNPATGEELARFEAAAPAEVDAALTAAVAAQALWRLKPVEERAALLGSVADVLRRERAQLARLITLEMGKPIIEAEAEIEKCAANCDYYAGRAPAFLADQASEGSAQENAVIFDPLGVVLAIMPWNFPFWQVFRFLAPALAAGNGAVLKHAANVPQCALAIDRVVRDAGAPQGLFRALLVPSGEVERLIADDRIAAVTLTGSTEVGRKVAAQAGGLIKKQVLELGGSDPFLVLADADLEKAAAAGVKARYANAGQSCIDAKRFIVIESVADRFTELFVAKARDLTMGDPLQKETGIGPLARADLRDTLHRQVQETVEAGGRLLLGGTIPDGPGAFYPPTVVDRVTPQMAMFAEETFGPAAAIVRARDEEEAIALANGTSFGLGASLWTGDLEKARQLARRIEAGSVFVNAIVASDPRLPFGGVKRSGYGRELSVFGIREFVNVKTLCVNPG